MKVAIAWYGAEGQASYRYFRERGDQVTIVTPKVSPQFPIPDGAELITGDDAFSHLDGFDLVVRSSGVRPETLRTDGKIWSSTNEFFARCPAPIIGVTGTKGKGTTSSFIASILRAAGKQVHLVGNIGVPALAVLPDIAADDIVVFELSSFQLWDLEKSPHVAVVLMIEPDHLDVHASMEEYVDAKAGSSRHQTAADIVISHPLNRFSQQIADQSPGQRYHYADSGTDEIYIRDDAFWRNDTRICPISAVKLVGDFNLENACAAIAASYIFTQDTTAIEQGLADFSGLPHRLQFVREVDGVRWYDDSIATTPGSAIAAMRSFRQPKVIILGGSDKGASYEELVAVAKQTSSSVVAIGQTGSQIADLCVAQKVPVVRVAGLMPEVVAAAKKIATSPGTVILSPASASFDQYTSYSHRGDSFIAAVEGL